MNTIQRITGQSYITPQTSKARNSAEKKVLDTITDRYIPEKDCAAQPESAAIELTKEAAAELARDYNAQNMSRNQYTKLIAELRGSGVLTQSEFSIAYGGALPPDTKDIAWPCGAETLDFSAFVKDCESCCKEYLAGHENTMTREEKNHSQAMISTYSKLNQIFGQLNSVRARAEDVSGSDAGYSAEFQRLYGLLKQDKDYAAYLDQCLKYNAGTAGPNTACDQLFKEYVLSDDKRMEEFAKYTWTANAKIAANHMEWNRTHPNLPVRVENIPPDYTTYLNEFRQKLHGSQQSIHDAYLSYNSFMISKARTERLTEEERFMFPAAANYERANWQNFDEKMQPVGESIQEGLSQSGFALDVDREYQFYLDTATFTFSVKGGTEEENSRIAEIINANPKESYAFNPLKTTIYALYFHRQTDLRYNPWLVSNTGANREQYEKYGIADVSSDYAKKMSQYLAAYRRCVMDHNLRERFGFGIDDISYRNGRWQGKTAEITEFIEDMDKNGDWSKQIGDAYRNLMNDYTGTPVFSEPVFVLKNGKFQVTYEEKR